MIMLMIYVLLGFLGLCFGSFVNALVWRLREQEKRDEFRDKSKKLKARSKKQVALSAKSRSISQTKHIADEELSILKGRSMCPNCHYTLHIKDLIPVLSWLSLKGRCRYCHKKIAFQYPLVELVTGGLFAISYYLWPSLSTNLDRFSFGVWLVTLTGLIALTIYDLKWQLLPNRVVYPLIVLLATSILTKVILFDADFTLLQDAAWGFLVGGGLFCLLFYISNGKWIGGGDVKLGALLGLVVAKADLAFLLLFMASVLGTVVIIPGMLTKKINSKSHIPFGPFLIVAGFIVLFWGRQMIDWYIDTFLTL